MRVVCAVVFGLLCQHASWAGSLQVMVTNAAGERLEHAVVSIHGDTPEVANEPDLAIMDQRNRQFEPTVLPIQQGTQVAFPNSDDVRHHVYSFSMPNNFELKLYHAEDTAPISFDHPGIVVLGCNIHDGMIGYVQVLDTPWFAKTGPEGVAAIEQVPTGKYTLQVWHPDLGIDYLRQALTITDGQQLQEISFDTHPSSHSHQTSVSSPLQALFDD